MAPAVLSDDAFTAADGYRLPIRHWLPQTSRPRAVVLALHGFNDYSNAFAEPGKIFAEHDIATYAYDQRGFGATADPGIWPGAQTMVADLYAVAAEVRRRHPGVPFYVLGESMGGAVAMKALTSPPPVGYQPLEPAGAILVAPAVWGRDTMSVFHRAALWLSVNTVPWMKLSAPKGLKIKASDNIEMLRALGRDPLVIKGTRVDSVNGLTDLMSDALAAAPRLTVPSLVLYGAHEQVLPKEPIEKALKALPAGRHRVAEYPDGYHMLMRDIHAQVVLTDIVSWLSDPVADLPSGHGRAADGMIAEKPDAPKAVP
ncbi:MAG TPA: alpha/beta hydrolase [Azospirillaceae bacterium]|nr:alpha/beta hydrolase [Azospirillaceae bacterium]